MNDSSRTQGGMICAGVALLALLFLAGLLRESYWAIAIPVAILTFFVLGLAFWVGWTIMTIQVEPEPPLDAPPEPTPPAPGETPASPQSS
jgi:hypothetical protein